MFNFMNWYINIKKNHVYNNINSSDNNSMSKKIAINKDNSAHEGSSLLVKVESSSKILKSEEIEFQTVNCRPDIFVYNNIGFTEIYRMGKYENEMKKIYKNGFGNDNFNKECPYKDTDKAILMKVGEVIVGYAFIHENGGDETHNIKDPFFYNFVIDTPHQHKGYGTLLLIELQNYSALQNNDLYCLCDMKDKQTNKWYYKRGGKPIDNWKKFNVLKWTL